VKTTNKITFIKKYLIYLFRWQCGTPILAAVMYILPFGDLAKILWANLVGGLIFFWIDLFIFKDKSKDSEKELNT